MWTSGNFEALDRNLPYKKDITVPYNAGETYSLRILASLDERRYSVWVRTPDDNAYARLADLYRFRSAFRDSIVKLETLCVKGQDARDSFTANNLGWGYYHESSPTWQPNDRDFESPSCAGLYWGSEETPMTGESIIRVWPVQNRIDGVVAFGDTTIPNINEFEDFAMLVRMNSDGLFDVRDGAVYRSDATFQYEGGKGYAIRVVFDRSQSTYDVWVKCIPLTTGESCPEVKIADSYNFRADAAPPQNFHHVCFKNPAGTSRDFYVTGARPGILL